MQIPRPTDLEHYRVHRNVRSSQSSIVVLQVGSLYLCSPVLEAALQALNLTNLDLNLPAQLLVLGGQVLEVRCALIRILQGRNKRLPDANRI